MDASYSTSFPAFCCGCRHFQDRLIEDLAGALMGVKKTCIYYPTKYAGVSREFRGGKQVYYCQLSGGMKDAYTLEIITDHFFSGV